MFKLLVVIAITFGFTLAEIKFNVEFENVPSPRQRMFHPSKKFQFRWRSNASSNRTMYVIDPLGTTAAHIHLCIYPKKGFIDQTTTLTINNIRYSNDGGSDVISLRVRSASIGQFTTVEKYNSGYEWNVFRDSGKIGEPITLGRGENILAISFKTDKWGVEIDTIDFSLSNDNISGQVICRSQIV